ncbi:MAG: hypothetical protein H0U52_06730 [Chloroflexi bacterium]|nr:hypothetical protein [Chloroflexota bacterium]
MKRLGAPPTLPKDIRVWNSRLLAEVQWLSMQGLITVDLAASLRANAGAIDRALPVERSQVDGEDDDEEEPTGSELEDLDGPAPLRVEAR